jgi:hypothetical protein
MQAIGGGPRLLEGGKVSIDGVDEGFDAAFTDRPNPRTAVGVAADGKILLFTVDGRSELSHGATLPELAAIMSRYGVIDGINLDGGGSTTMAADGVTVDLPAAPGGGRNVADMLVVYGDYSQSRPPVDAAILTPANPVVDGATAQLSVSVDSKTLPNNDKRVLWRGVTDGGVGFVSQDGVFHALRAGTGTVTAIVDGSRITAPVTVKTAESPHGPFLLTADLGALPGQTDKSVLAVRVADADGVVGAGVAITIDVKGGAADRATASTDEDGIARFAITWTEASGSIVIHAAAFPDLTVVYPAAALQSPASSGAAISTPTQIQPTEATKSNK